LNRLEDKINEESGRLKCLCIILVNSNLASSLLAIDLYSGVIEVLYFGIRNSSNRFILKVLNLTETKLRHPKVKDHKRWGIGGVGLYYVCVRGVVGS